MVLLILQEIYLVNGTLHSSTVSKSNKITNNKSTHKRYKHIEHMRKEVNEYKPVFSRHPPHPHTQMVPQRVLPSSDVKLFLVVVLSLRP